MDMTAYPLADMHRRSCMPAVSGVRGRMSLRKWIVGLVGLSLATGTGVAVAGSAAAAPARDRTTGAAAAAARGAGGAADAGAAGVDDQPGPLEQKRRAERTAAVSRVL